MRDPHNMDYPPTKWPSSPRIVVQYAPLTSNGPNHLGLCARRRGVAIFFGDNKDWLKAIKAEIAEEANKEALDRANSAAGVMTHTASKKGSVSIGDKRRNAYVQLVLPKIAGAHGTSKRSTFVTVSNQTARKISCGEFKAVEGEFTVEPPGNILAGEHDVPFGTNSLKKKGGSEAVLELLVEPADGRSGHPDLVRLRWSNMWADDDRGKWWDAEAPHGLRVEAFATQENNNHVSFTIKDGQGTLAKYGGTDGAGWRASLARDMGCELTDVADEDDMMAMAEAHVATANRGRRRSVSEVFRASQNGSDLVAHSSAPVAAGRSGRRGSLTDIVLEGAEDRVNPITAAQHELHGNFNLAAELELRREFMMMRAVPRLMQAVMNARRSVFVELINETVRNPTTWTILRHDGPNHLGLRYNVLPAHQMALIASGCVPFRTGSSAARATGWTTAGGRSNL